VQRILADGTLSWSRQFGSGGADTATAVVALPSGRIAIAGHTTGALGGPLLGSTDAFLALLEPDGSTVWIEQFVVGSEFALATDLASDGTTLYVVGRTRGGASTEAFVAAFALDGEPRWMQRYASGGEARAEGVTIGRDGFVHVAGVRSEVPFGQDDAMLLTYDPDGRLVWERAFGTEEVERAKSVATDAAGRVLVVGETEGALHVPAGSEPANRDAYVRMHGP
jgi:outer membrane protein assembly factor BamB